MDQCEKAIPFLEKALRYQPKDYLTILNLAVCYNSLGREEEASATATEFLKLNPNFTLEKFARQMLHGGAVKERFLKNCRKAGLK
jgi:tetratricopeptide (TPR) repeat protein